MILEKLKELKFPDLITIVVPGIILVGFSYKFGFYSSKVIGVTWVLSLFSPVDFITAQFDLYFYYLIAVVYLERVIDGKQDLRVGLIRANALMIGSFIGLYFLIGELALTSYMYAFVSLHAIALILYNNSIGLRSLSLLAIFIFMPMISGSIAADNVRDKILPMVKLNKQNEIDGSWFLLDKFSDKAILINTTQEKNYFKVVELKEIEFIESSKNKNS